MGQMQFDRLRSTATAARRPLEQEGEPLIRPEDPSIGRQLGAAVGITNDFAIASRAIDEWTRERGEYDPDLQPGTLLANNPKYAWLLQAANDDDDLFDALHGAWNERDLFATADNFIERSEAFQDAYHNTALGIGGNALGILLSPSTYLPTVALKGAQVVGLSARAVHNARRASALRLALLEGTAQAGVGALEAVSDPSFGLGEIGVQAGFGAVAGGLVGAIAPGAALLDDLGPKVRPSTFSRATDTAEGVAGDIVEVEARALSAGVEDELPVGAGSPERAQSAFVLKDTILGPEFFRNAKQQVLNYLHVYGRGETRSANAVRAFGDLMGKMWHWDVPTRGEAAGLTVRGESVEAFKEIKLRSAIGGEMTATVRGAYNKMIQSTPALARTGWNRTVAVMPGGSAWWLKKPITRSEFNQFQAKIMRLMEHSRNDFDTAATKVIDQKFGPELDIKVKANVIEALREATNARIQAFRKVAEMVVEEQMDGWELVARNLENPAYIPQAYDVGRVLSREDALIERLLRAWGQRPPQEVIDDFLGKFAEDLGEGAPTAGAKWDDLTIEQREDIRQYMWAGRAEELIAAAEKEAARLDKLLKKGPKARTQEALEQAVTDAEAAWNRTNEKLARKLKDPRSVGASQKAILEELAGREEAWNQLRLVLDGVRAGRLKLKDIETRLAAARKATDNPRVRKALKKVAEVRKGGKKLKAAAAAKVAKVTQETSEFDLQKLATDMIKNITRSLDEGESAFGFNMMGDIAATGKAGRLHPRQIDWAELLEEGDEVLDEVLINDPDELFENYIETVGTRLGFKKAFGTFDPGEDVAKAVIDELPAEIRDQAGRIFNAMMDRSLGRHHLKGTGQYEGLRWTAQVLKSLNVASMLGTATFTLPGDVSVTALSREMAQGAVGKTIRDFLHLPMAHRKGTRLVDNLTEAGHAELAALIAGARNLANTSARQTRLMDTEKIIRGRGVGKPGTRIWKAARLVQAGARQASELMMDLNLMNFWNSGWNHMLRPAHIVNLRTMAAKGFDELPENLQAVLRSSGIDGAALSRLDAAFKTKGTVKADSVELPDISKWSKADKELLRQYVETRSMNGIIEPGLGDMPLFANDPMGSLMFQFQGFPFTAQQKMVRRMQQKGIHDTLVQQSMMLMFFASVTALAARHVATGSPEKLDFSKPGNLTQFIYDMILRSPMAVAGAGMWSELFVGMAGRPINTALGERIVPQRGRLAERDLGNILLGPGMATGQNLLTAIPEIGTDIAKGEFGSAGERAVGSLPLISTHFLWRALENSLEED